MLIGAFATSYLGFALLALSQVRHWRRLVEMEPISFRETVVLRGTGLLLIAVSLGLSVYRDGPSFGSLLWMVLVSCAALSVAFTLSWRAQWLRPLARGLHHSRTLLLDRQSSSGDAQ